MRAIQPRLGYVLPDFQQFVDENLAVDLGLAAATVRHGVLGAFPFVDGEEFIAAMWESNWTMMTRALRETVGQLSLPGVVQGGVTISFMAPFSRREVILQWHRRLWIETESMDPGVAAEAFAVALRALGYLDAEAMPGPVLDIPWGAHVRIGVGMSDAEGESAVKKVLITLGQAFVYREDDEAAIIGASTRAPRPVPRIRASRRL